MKVKHYVIHWLVIVAMILGAFLLQCNLCSWIPGLETAPNLLLIVTFTVGILDGRVSGMVTGLLSGLLMDAFGGGVLGYYMLIYIYIGYFNGLVSSVLVTDIILLPILMCLVNEFCYSLYIYVFSFLLNQHFEIWRYLNRIVIPEFIMTLVCTILIYGIMVVLNRRLKHNLKKGEEHFAEGFNRTIS